MIDPSKLMVGNIVLYNGKYHRWQENDYIDKQIRVNGEYVPINNEILEMAKFAKQKDESYALESILLHHDSIWWYSIDATYIETEDGSNWRQITYLHELQNVSSLIQKIELQITL